MIAPRRVRTVRRPVPVEAPRDGAGDSPLRYNSVHMHVSGAQRLKPGPVSGERGRGAGGPRASFNVVGISYYEYTLIHVRYAEIDDARSTSALYLGTQA